MSYRDHTSSCIYADLPKYDSWSGQVGEARMTPPEDVFSKEKHPLREKNRKTSVYRHVPHKDKPPQVVARRNARERRRVQAVNSAFVRLRKAVPIQNARGKRVSKVRTLQSAIEYIRALQRILQQGSYGFNYEIFQEKYYCKNGYYMDDIDFDF